jgi:hypothetical protein
MEQKSGLPSEEVLLNVEGADAPGAVRPLLLPPPGLHLTAKFRNRVVQ